MVPSGWKSEPLDKVSKIIDCKHRTPKYVHSGIPLVSPGTIKWGKIDLESPTKRVTETEYESLMDHCSVDLGDLVLSRNQSVGIASYVDTLKPFVLGQDTVLIKPNYTDSKFLFYSLQSTATQRIIFKLAGGSTFSRINLGDIRKLKGVYPPLPEQRKIAQILSTWDKAIGTTESLITNSQQQKKSLMQQLLTGKKRFAGFEGKFNVREGFAKRKLGLLPIDWHVDQMPNHYWFQEGPGVRKHQFTETGVKLFNGTNIQKSRIQIENTKTHISNEEAYGVYNHFLADEGDLVIACSGISVDKFDEKIAFIEIQHLPLCMNTSTMRFKVRNNEEACIHYLRYYMMSNLFKDQIRRQITGSAQLNFGPSHVSQCFIVLPTFEEQQKIASALTFADQEIDTLQQKLTHLKQEKKALMQQLLTGKRRVKVDNETEAA